jgi:hypothetical protein
MNKPKAGPSLTMTLAFYPGDVAKTKSLLEWIADLGGARRHNLLLVADADVPITTIRELIEIAKPSFFEVDAITVQVPPDMKGWTKAPSRLFFKTAEYNKLHYKTAFLWMEADAIPLCETWLDQLADEYHKSSRRWMGAIIKNSYDNSLPVHHMNGVGIYPHDAWDFYQSRVERVFLSGGPWDIFDADKMIGSTRNTMLIQCVWGFPGKHPVIVKQRNQDDPDNFIEFDSIRENAVLFHKDASQSLIPLLREKLFGV